MRNFQIMIVNEQNNKNTSAESISEAITEEKVLYVAGLAKIGLSTDEAKMYATQMTAIIDYMNLLGEVDTDGIEMTHQVTGLKNIMREDSLEDYTPSDKLLECSILPKLNNSIAVKAIIKEQ